MKLTYWVAVNKQDASCYNLRAKTKKRVLELIKLSGHDDEHYGTPKKVEIEYDDGFDLLTQALGEGGLSYLEED
jgi:hypothetical protein